MQPLRPAEVERVISSLNNIADELQRMGKTPEVELPVEAVAVTEMLWSLQDALMAAEKSPLVLTPGMQRSLAAAGYTDSADMVDEWQIEAQLVLEAYEVLRRHLSLDTVQAGYAALEKDLPRLSPEEALVRERTMNRDHQLVLTTGKDLALVGRYRPQLDKLAGRLGLGAGS